MSNFHPWLMHDIAPQLGPGASNIYYVNGGSDGPTDDLGAGTRDAPKRTLQAGIDLTTAGQNDYVVVLNYGSNARAVEAWPVEVNKDMIHIVGVGTVGQKWPVVSVQAPGGADSANPALLITADRCRVANLELGGGDAAGCVHLGTGGGTWGTVLHDCFFGVTGDGVGQDGIRILASAAPYTTVYGCRFGLFLTRDGVRFDGNATRCMIGIPGLPRNYFHHLPGIAINVVAAATQPGIFENRIAIPANTGGAGITLGVGVLDAWVFDNHANFGDTDMGNNPFADGAGAGANDWGGNMQGITLTQPS